MTQHFQIHTDLKAYDIRTWYCRLTVSILSKVSITSDNFLQKIGFIQGKREVDRGYALDRQRGYFVTKVNLTHLFIDTRGTQFAPDLVNRLGDGSK